MTTSIYNVIIDNTLAGLVEQLDLAVQQEGLTYLVRAGLLQDDPTGAGINLLMHPGGDDWEHDLNTTSSRDAVISPIFETGGGRSEWYWLRFILEYRMYHETEDRDEARRISHIMLSRIRYALRTLLVDWPADDFGEGVVLIQPRNHHLKEGGGEGMFIWTGKMKLEYLVQTS